LKSSGGGGGTAGKPLLLGTNFALSGIFGFFGTAFFSVISDGFFLPPMALILLCKKSPPAFRRRISNLRSSTMVITAARMTSSTAKTITRPTTEA
jgi:hypothetical protein